MYVEKQVRVCHRDTWHTGIYKIYILYKCYTSDHVFACYATHIKQDMPQNISRCGNTVFGSTKNGVS